MKAPPCGFTRGVRKPTAVSLMLWDFVTYLIGEKKGTEMTQHPVVGAIKKRMLTLGIDLDEHIKEPDGVLNSWANGFNFIPNDWMAFAWALHRSGRFCVPGADITGAMDAGRFQKGHPSWREDEKDSSLHVIYHIGKPWSTYEKVIRYYQIHIDSVSVVAGKDEAGKCLYDWSSLGTHALVDLLHLPFVLPEESKKSKSLQFGFHF